ncbi:MAG: M48 family metalloprotease, partial [Planctomycetes bacterium]|nr:M48 family metalloprotease [Planctomycetota bacterium]
MPIRFLVAILLSLAVFADPEAVAPGSATGLGVLAAAVVLVALAGLGLWARLAWRARRTPDAEALFAWHGRTSALYAWLAIAVYAVVLFLGQWPQTVFGWLPAWMGTDLWLPQRLLILLPFVLLVLVTWIVGHRMSRVVRRAAEMQYGEVRVSVGLPRYLVFQTRTQLLIFLAPYVFVLACHNVAVLACGGGLSDGTEMIVLAVPMLLVYVLSPWLLRVVWSTARMEDGPLRTRLEQVARRAGVYVRDIIVWRTDGLMVNACMTGLGRPLRYVFLTDTLIDSLQPVQVEAVFAHELGHARFR